MPMCCARWRLVEGADLPAHQDGVWVWHVICGMQLCKLKWTCMVHVIDLSSVRACRVALNVLQHTVMAVRIIFVEKYRQIGAERCVTTITNKPYQRRLKC